jgi:hypothetical protein
VRLETGLKSAVMVVCRGQVAAVFVDGKQWQFKDWPKFGGESYKDVTTILSKGARVSGEVAKVSDCSRTVKGYHVKYDDEKTDRAVADMNVEVLMIPRYKRHLDQAAVKRFWDTLIEYMKMRRMPIGRES